MIGYAALAAFIATIPTANWMIQHVGTVCAPQGPCLIPVGFGLEAPSGVLMIGLALVLRDLVHQQMGWRIAMLGIVVGAALSALLAPPALVFASGAAFLLSEIADLLVYAPLARRRLIAAVVASGIVGAVIDSALFLLIAFGSLNFLTGQVVGKMWATLIAIPVIWSIRWQHGRASGF